MRFPQAVMVAALIAVAVAICYWGITDWEIESRGMAPVYLSGPRQLGESLGVGALVGFPAGFLLNAILRWGSRRAAKAQRPVE
jgi:hypothetical protein